MQQHEVDSAADALLAQQVRPTVERVRHEVAALIEENMQLREQLSRLQREVRAA